MTKVSKEFTLLDLCEKLLLFLYSVFEIIHTHCHKDTLQEQVCWPQVCLCSALVRLCHTRQECWWWRDCRRNDFTGSHCHGAQTTQTLLTFITSHYSSFGRGSLIQNNLHYVFTTRTEQLKFLWVVMVETIAEAHESPDLWTYNV